MKDPPPELKVAWEGHQITCAFTLLHLLIEYHESSIRQLGEKLNSMYVSLTKEIKTSDLDNTQKKKVLVIQETQLTAAVRLYKESRDIKTDRKIRDLYYHEYGKVDMIDVSGPSTSS